MDRHIEAFLEMQAAERGAARNTLAAYETDLVAFAAFATTRAHGSATADTPTLRAWLASLSAAGYAARSVARKLSALRQFHHFLVSEDIREDDPTQLLDTPKRPVTLPKFLSETEVDSLLAAARARPPHHAPLATAALEMLYATGLRISELLALPRNALAGDAALLMIKGKGG